MSAKYTFWAWSVDIKKAPLKLTLLKLADNANDDGVSWYSVHKMAASCGMSDRAFQGHLLTLKNMGLLKVTDRPGTSRVYHLQYQEATLIADPRRICIPPPQNLHPTPADSADDPNNESTMEPITPISPSGGDSDSKGRNKNKVTYDKSTIVKCWNDKADRYGLPRIRAVSDTTAKRLNKFYTKYRKLQKELGKESREPTDIICRFIEAYEPSAYALGQNSSGKKHGIDIAFTDWFVDQELAKE